MRGKMKYTRYMIFPLLILNLTAAIGFTDEDSDKFLKMTGFSMQYVEIEKPQGRNGECGHCKAVIYIPEGSYKVYCESCHKTTKVQSVFKCMSCGAENNVPDYPSKPIDCAYCGVENRLIQGLFG